MSQLANREHPHDNLGRGHEARRPSGMLLLPAEARTVSSSATPMLDDPDLAGNPVALAHARALRQGESPTAGGGNPAAAALIFLVVAPTIVLLVSNPLGLLVMFLLCLLLGYLIGFGGAL